nr:mucosal pentraxin-like [Anolis sagrei ordinatus]
MAVLRLFVLIFAGLLESLAQEGKILNVCLSTDLQNQAFVFPVESNTAAVVLKAQIPQPLTSFTLCLRYYTLLTRQYTLFSYATKTSDNHLLLFKPTPNQYSVYIGGPAVTFILPEKKNAQPAWEHICVSWESATGLVALWLDGKPLPRLGLQKGFSINNDASIVLGQDQDTFGGGFATDQSFVGEIKDVFLWARALSTDEVCRVLDDCPLSNYLSLINWRGLTYEIQGYVVLQHCLTSCISSGIL